MDARTHIGDAQKDSRVECLCAHRIGLACPFCVQMMRV